MEREMRRTRKLRPLAEHLEGRQLLNGDMLGPGGKPINQKDLNALIQKRTNGVPLSGRRMDYSTPGGAQVTISLYGPGSLAGSAVRPDGTLDLVYNRTNQATGIVAKVRGAGGAKLGSVRDADVSFDNLSGVGSNLVRVVNLKGFDLVDGGKVNLTGGVNALFLNSVGKNTQMNLREIPAAYLTASTAATASLTVTQDGRTTNYANEPNGGRVLTGVSGQFVPGASLENPLQPGQDVPDAPAGIALTVNQVNGGSSATAGTLNAAQIFGYDPTANQLIRFDTGTGQALQTINLPGATPATGSAGVGLSRVNGRLTALVGVGSQVYGYDATTGNAAGSFSIAGLAPSGLTSVDGIGSSETRTILIDAGAGGGGVAQIIDAAASLASGQAVTVGSAYTPTRQFELAGGVASPAGRSNIYATGAAHFDSFQPNLLQPGFLTLSGAGGTLNELGRTQITSPQSISNLTIVPGTTDGTPLKALGSVEANLALVTGQVGGVNTVSLYAPGSFAPAGAITLNDPNALTGLSPSFHPELVDSALIDIQGNVQSIRIKSAQGMVINDSGNLNLLQINDASNSTVIGQPLTHLDITRRTNVTARSNIRSAGMRGDVTVNPNQSQVGPLSLPTA
ncbi:hypothetical protein EP7_005455 [Isosphaeraceae bacterium EP7]